MAIKFSSLKPGMVLYERHKATVGNTTIRHWGEFSVTMVRLDAEVCGGGWVRWNGNPEEHWSRRRLQRLYTWSMYDPTEAEITRGFGGGVKRVRRLPAAERKRLKAEKAKVAP